MGTDGFDGLLGGGFVVRKGEDFGGEVAGVVDFFQGGDDGFGIGVAEAHGAAVGIGVMNVADVFACGAEGCGEVGFLDVHVEQIGEEDDVFQGVRFDEIRAIGKAVDEVGFVAVEWLVNERNVVFRSGSTSDDKGFSEPFERLVFGNLAAVFSLHRTENGRCTELAAEGDHLFEEIESGNAFVEGWIG